MNILWITNSLLPEATEMLNGQKELKGTGSWVLGLAEALLQYSCDIHLTIASVTSLVKRLTRLQGKHIVYYAIPYCGVDNKYRKDYESAYLRVYQNVMPDVVHIHGTEYPHSLAALRASGVDHTVVSLQGMVSSIAPYYLGGLSKQEIWRNMTFHDILRPNLIMQQREMAKRGVFEVELLKESKYVMGRTSWDRSHIWALNPNAHYFHCDEVLRKEFYQGPTWSYTSCEPYSIFVSQGYYPLKGLHKLIDAIAIVKCHYQNVKLRVAGRDFTYSNGGFDSAFRISSYGRIIKKQIKAAKLDSSVCFIGNLNAESMKKEYLRCNVFVCPSSIENSPNSLGEAQILGVPCLSSYVGGIPDMMKNDEEHLYRFEEVEMLAEKIIRIFELKDELTPNALRLKALERHDAEKNVKRLLNIYDEIKS